MNRNIIHILWAAALLLTACTQEEFPQSNTSDTTPLSITVTDGGYSSDGQQTKATENGYRTEFTAGDVCGLYVVRGGTSVYDNVKLTATAGTDGNLTWQPEASVTLVGGFPDESYFLYYPYQSDMTGKTAASATDAEGFFAPLVSGWQPKADQSTYANYTASDLMTAKGTANKDGNKLNLSFSMTHRMAMAVIEMPKTVYKFTNTTTIPDCIVGFSVDFTDSRVKPYGISSGTYRCIVNPAGSAAASITGSYDDGKKEFSVTPDGIDAGSCKTYKVDGAIQSEKQTTLQMGDYFCKGSDDGWYIIPQEAVPDHNVIGVVFKTGFQDSDNRSSYNTSLTEYGPKIPDGVFHGYVVALTDANNGTEDMICWESGPNYERDQSVGTSATSDDWQGYSNSLKFHEFVKNNNSWEMKHFPAALACETYGNRTIDQDGNPTDAYGWQKPLSAPKNTSGWFLPSCGQLKYLYHNASFLSARMTEVKNSIIVDCEYRGHINWFDQLDSRYWSSSEDGNSAAARAMYFYRELVMITTKSYDAYVRPILAF